jgi:hypothetical protein
VATPARSWQSVTDVRLDRYLLIACVTLWQACDSKRSPVPSGSEPQPEPEFVVTATQQGILVDGQVIEPFIEGGLPPEVVDASYRPIKLVPILAKITTDSLRLIVDKELSSWIVFQLIAAAPSNVTRFKLEAVELRRGQEPSTATLSNDELLMTESKELVALDPAATRAARLREVVARLPDRERFDLVVDRTLKTQRLLEVVGALAPLVGKVGISPAETDGPSNMFLTYRTEAADAVIGEYFAKNEKQIRRCFEESLKRDGPTLGYDVRVTMHFGKAGLGNVATVAPHISILLSRCLAKRIRSWDLKMKPGDYVFHINLVVK